MVEKVIIAAYISSWISTIIDSLIHRDGFKIEFDKSNKDDVRRVTKLWVYTIPFVAVFAPILWIVSLICHLRGNGIKGVHLVIQNGKVIHNEMVMDKSRGE